MKELDNYFGISQGEKHWLSELGAAKSAAITLLENGEWHGQYSLPGFHEPPNDLLVSNPKAEKKK